MEKIVLMVEFNVKMKNKTYFLYLRYFATGEGITDSCGVVLETTKNKAIEKFLRQGMLKSLTDEKHIQYGVEHFSPGVTIYDLGVKRNHVKVAKILKDYLSEFAITAILAAAEGHALHDFNFHLYRNYS